jgi:hypothetical protein
MLRFATRWHPSLSQARRRLDWRAAPPHGIIGANPLDRTGPQRERCQLIRLVAEIKGHGTRAHAAADRAQLETMRGARATWRHPMKCLR